MSFWAATIPNDGKPLTIGEDECDIIITQACMKDSGNLSAGTLVNLLAMNGSSNWVSLARFRTGESECTPLRIVVTAGSELSLKVSNAVTFVAYVFGLLLSDKCTGSCRW